MDTQNSRHPKWDELYTPITPEIVEMLNGLRQRHGSWEAVAFYVDTRQRIIRRIRKRHQKSITMALLDRILTAVGTGNLEEYTWFTADDLVVMGIWKPYIEVRGRVRIQGERSWELLPPMLRHGRTRRGLS